MYLKNAFFSRGSSERDISFFENWKKNYLQQSFFRTKRALNIFQKKAAMLLMIVIIF